MKDRFRDVETVLFSGTADAQVEGEPRFYTTVFSLIDCGTALACTRSSGGNFGQKCGACFVGFVKVGFSFTETFLRFRGDDSLLFLRGLAGIDLGMR